MTSLCTRITALTLLIIPFASIANACQDESDLIDSLTSFGNTFCGKSLEGFVNGEGESPEITNFLIQLNADCSFLNYRQSRSTSEVEERFRGRVVEIYRRQHLGVMNELTRYEINQKQFEQHLLTGSLDPELENLLGYLGYQAIIIGISSLDSVAFDDIARSSQNEVFVNEDYSVQLVSQHPTRGSYIFDFRAFGDRLLPIKIQCRKKANHVFDLGDGISQRVGDLRINDQETFGGLILHANLEWNSVASNETTLKSLLIEEETIGSTGTSHKSVRRVSINSIEPTNEADFTNFSLTAVDSSEPKTIRVLGHDQVIHYLYQGKIRKAIDTEAETAAQTFLADQGSRETRPRLESSDDSLFRTSYLRTQHNLHCGLYACYLGFSSLGADVPIEKLISSDYISDEHGSTAADLMRAAEDFNVPAFYTDRLTLTELKHSDRPIVLLLESKRRPEGAFHWVLYLGESNGKAMIWDAPRPPAEIEYSDLLAEWRGVGVVLGKRKRPLVWIGFAVLDLTWPAGLSLAVVLIARSVVSKISSFSTLAESGLPQATLLTALAFVLSIAFYFLSVKGFSDSQVPIASILFRPTPESFLSVDAEHLRQTPRSFTLIDARQPHAFNLGHIEGAINLPADATIPEIREALERIPRNKPVVVYCESEHCAWDSAVASRLSNLGFEDVKLYKKGWRDWSDLDIALN